MSILCQRLESSIMKWFLQASTPETEISNRFALATEALNVRTTNYGITWDSAYGSFDLNFYTGLSQIEQVYPAVTISCVETEVEPAAPQVRTCAAQIALHYPADDSVDVGSISKAMHGVGSWLESEIYSRPELRDGIEKADHTVIVTGVLHGSTSRGFDDASRRRWILFQVSVIAALGPFI
jgi:hypothetical protein